MDAILKKHEEAVCDIENWDDDDLELAGDEFAFRGASFATSHAPSHHRDSTSSRRSFRSEYESNFEDENKEFLLPGDDDRSTTDAIAAATRAGVPIPKGVPASALMGGTIKRLGGKKIKKVIEEDWELDMDIANLKDGGLKLKYQDPSNFPENLRRVSGPGIPRSTHPSKSLEPAPVFNLSQRSDQQNTSLDRFREQDDDSDFFGDSATIKLPKRRKPHASILPMASQLPTSQKDGNWFDDDPEQGLEVPDGPLTLSDRRDIPKTPSSHDQDDFDWGESSLGTRFAGTRRDMRSTRSSSVSGVSPSVSSTFTMESEDEDLKGLIIPTGPLRFTDMLQKRQLARSPDRVPRQQLNVKQTTKAVPADADFLNGLVIGDDVFTQKTLTINRNVKLKPIRQTSPTRTKAAVSLTFTNKPSVTSRMTRTSDRPTMSLEPVSESGDPIIKKATKHQPRLGHSAQSSVSSATTPTTPSSVHSLPPHFSTPHRRELRSKPSASALRNEATTTGAQLLKSKRSMPNVGSYTRSPPKAMATRFERPSSRADTLTRLSRPKTPVDRDRATAEGNVSHARKNPTPFLPAGAPQSQSHHVMNKNSSFLRRKDSDSSNVSNEFRPSSRAFSRAGMRSPSPQRLRHSKTSEALAREAKAKRNINKPLTKHNYGDGRELDAFDDLPTSQQVEQKYTKYPSQRGPPKTGSLRKRAAQNTAPDRVSTPTLTSMFNSPAKTENLPRFARDTNASRLAREAVLAQRAPSAAGAPLSTVTNSLRSHTSARAGLNSPVQNGTIKPKKSKKPQQLKPHLIKPLGNAHTHPKAVNGMVYNVQALRWEGNEHELSPFDVPEAMTPRPALISNVNGLNGPQISGDMFFHPALMKWLKIKTSESITSEGNDTMDGFDALEDDTFKDIPDLQDNSTDVDESGVRGDGVIKDEYLVTEEFDVGPIFVDFQREEEAKWTKKCQQWVGEGKDWLVRDGKDTWRWNIRDVVSNMQK